MDAAFNFKSKSVVCFHLELKPITVGHLFLIDECEIDLFDLSDSPLNDLLAAALIFAQDHKKSRKLQSSRCLKFVARWWAWRCKKLSIGEETTRFQEWLADQFQLPQISRDLTGGGVSQSEIPTRWRLISLLMSEFGMSREEALMTTVRDANCLWVARDEREGRVKLMSQRQKSLIAFAREQDALKGLN